MEAECVCGRKREGAVCTTASASLHLGARHADGRRDAVQTDGRLWSRLDAAAWSASRVTPPPPCFYSPCVLAMDTETGCRWDMLLLLCILLSQSNTILFYIIYKTERLKRYR